MDERRKGRCQMCGELVDDEGWDGHTVAVMGDDGWPEPASCGPIDFEELRKRERRVIVTDVHPMTLPMETIYLFKFCSNLWREDRRESERRKGE